MNFIIYQIKFVYCLGLLDLFIEKYQKKIYCKITDNIVFLQGWIKNPGSKVLFKNVIIRNLLELNQRLWGSTLTKRQKKYLVLKKLIYRNMYHKYHINVRNYSKTKYTWRCVMLKSLETYVEN